MRSEYHFGGGPHHAQANDLASALEKQRYEMKIDALKVDVERLRRSTRPLAAILERKGLTQKMPSPKLSKDCAWKSRAIAERERDVLQSDLKRAMRQANDKLEQKTREAVQANEDFLDAKRKLEKLKLEKSCVSRAMEGLHQTHEDAVGSAVTNPTSPRPPPGTKAATAYVANQQHISSSQTNIFVVTSEHVKILSEWYRVLLTAKFLRSENVNVTAEF